MKGEVTSQIDHAHLWTVNCSTLSQQNARISVELFRDGYRCQNYHFLCIFSSQELCRVIHCSPPRILDGRNCSLPNQTRDIIAEFYIRIEPIAQLSVDDGELNISEIHVVVREWLAQHRIRDDMICKFEMYNVKRLTEISDSLPILIYIRVRKLNESYFQHLFNEIVGFVDDNFWSSLLIRNWTVFLDGKHYEPGDLQTVQTDVTERRRRYTELGTRKRCSPAIRITALNDCPQFYLKTKEFRLTYNDTVCLRNSSKCFPKHKYKEIDGTVAICIRDYLLSSGQEYNVKFQDVVASWVAFGFTCLSVVCLILTLLTYCLFCELRTVPGMNNMALSTFLIIAQLLFEFGFNATAIQTICKVIGVCIHFFWLATTFSMSSCSVHMFRTFANLTGTLSTTITQSREFIRYFIYCIVMSTVFVLINIVYTLISSNQQDMGYGGVICYISTGQMIGFTLALPIGLVVVSNIAMFFVVVYRIHTLPNLKKNSTQERNNFLIYAKLSTLTGMAWIFEFAYQFTEIRVFQYMAIVTLCGQGIFIMLSFVCNARVLKLYMSRWCRARVYRNGSVETRSGTTSINDTTTSEFQNSRLSRKKEVSFY